MLSVDPVIVFGVQRREHWADVIRQPARPSVVMSDIVAPPVIVLKALAACDCVLFVKRHLYR